MCNQRCLTPKQNDSSAFIILIWCIFLACRRNFQFSFLFILHPIYLILVEAWRLEFEILEIYCRLHVSEDFGVARSVPFENSASYSFYKTIQMDYFQILLPLPFQTLEMIIFSLVGKSGLAKNLSSHYRVPLCPRPLSWPQWWKRGRRR
jgi:hypothetical protein